ncbi:MAG: sugar phosphate isomerase/epimerase [Clostridiales bacterium]|jgi:sugar phosphate isomerase/epimerase|nr:sugar phosphate isomerase/epimerase [Clostridiales bacterium]
MQLGAQLYTLRQFTQTEEDFRRTAERVARIGYKWVQISAVGDIPAKIIRQICDENGLMISVTHTAPDLLIGDVQRVIEDHRAMGADYVGIGSMPKQYPRTAAGADAFIKDYYPSAVALRDAGLHFMYHNHDFEFEKMDGILLFDRLADGFHKDLMGFILDTYWVQAGGGDPAWWLEKLSGRVDVIHFKDYSIVDGQRRMAEVMEGNLNWDAIAAACEKAGVLWAYVEQDDCYGKDPFDALELSLMNLNSYFSKKG